MKSIISNNKGIALVTSLLFTMITVGIILALFYVITQSIKISAATKRYRNVTEAAYGGGELMALDVIGNAWKNVDSANGISNSLVSMYGNIGLSVSASDDCIKQKLSYPTAYWTDCTAPQKSTELSAIRTSPDLTFLLKGVSTGKNYKLYAKIVDTTPGNTDTTLSSLLTADDSDGLLSASGSAYNKTGAGGVPVQHIPFGYRIEVQGEKETNAIEKANVTVLYAY
jgi:hypothetical protein